MRGFRFIHAADLHLDSPFAGLAGVPEQVRQTLRHSTFGALEQLVRLALSERVDFVLIAGDVYESADRSLRAQVRFHKAMRQLAENGISAFIIHGNHDPHDGRQAQLDWPERVHVFRAGQVETVPAVVPGKGHVADIHGISYPSASVRENYALAFRREGDAPYHIGLLHANVDGVSDHADYAPCTLAELTGRGMDYWALGHIHSRRVLHEVPFVVYPGNIQGRSVRETGPKGCYLVEVDESGTATLDFRVLDTVRWHQASLSIEGLGSEQELKDQLEGMLEEVRREAGGRPSVIRIELTGRGPLHSRITEGFVRELAEELRLAELERVGWDGAGAGTSGSVGRKENLQESASSGTAVRNAEEWMSSMGGGAAATDFVWVEKLAARTGAAVDREALEASSGFLGDVLRLAAETAREPEALASFAAECLEPLLSHAKAGALLHRAGLAEQGQIREDFARQSLEQAAEWLLDRLLDE